MSFNVTTDVLIVKKYGNTLLINNNGDRFSEYQWYKDGIAILGANGQYYSGPNKSLCGTYSCEVTRLSNGKRVKTTRQLEAVNCNGTKSYLLYPTLLTAGQCFTVESIGESSGEEGATPMFIEVYSVSGELLFTRLVLNNVKGQFESPTMAGAYIVRVIHGDEVLLNQKIVVR